MYFDTHAHYDDAAFDADRDKVLSALPEEGVEYVINPGCDVASSHAALALAEKYPFMYAAVGLHPENMKNHIKSSAVDLLLAMKHKKCVAIGEIGLDYHWNDKNKEDQRLFFESQLMLAKGLDKPVIIHDRDAHADSLELIKKYDGLRGVFHCFSGSAEMAQELLKRGWYLGFDGPITYKNARRTLEVLELCPLDRILIETDSPYLPPEPVRGTRNYSGNLRYICAKIAEIKGESTEKIAEITLNNGKELFGIGE